MSMDNWHKFFLSDELPEFKRSVLAGRIISISTAKYSTELPDSSSSHVSFSVP